MVYLITVFGIVLVFAVEYLIQKHESKDPFNFFKSVSLYKTIEQILIVILSATVAILMTNAAENKEKNEQYKKLLNELYLKVYSEKQFLYGYVTKTPEYEYLQNQSDEMINALLVHFDMTSMLNNVFNSNEAVLMLGPELYSETLSLIMERRTLLDALYANNTSVYEGRESCIKSIADADMKLEYLILAQIDYLNGQDDSHLADKYMEHFFNYTPTPSN